MDPTRQYKTFNFRQKYLWLKIIHLLFLNSLMQPCLVTETYAQDSSKLEVPKIYVGQDFLSKEEIFKYEKTKKEKSIGMVVGVTKDRERPPRIDKDEFELNRIDAIYAGEIDNEKGIEVLAAGGQKAFILDPQGKIKKVVNYNLGSYWSDGLRQEYNLPFISIVDVDNDGKVEIVGYGVGVGVILNLQGKILWRYKITKKYTDPDSIAVGDLDNDGKNEIIVGIENRIEIFKLNGTKIKTFKFSAETYETLLDKLKIVDFDNDGKFEILANKTIFNRNGENIKKIENPYPWLGTLAQNDEPIHLLGFENSKLYLSDTNGKNITLDAPLSKLKRKPHSETSIGYSLFSLEATQVKLTSAEKYLVVLANANDDEEFDYFKMLYIYNSRGRLVYQETIQAFNSEMSTLPNGNGTESLLITDDGKVNLYKVK